MASNSDGCTQGALSEILVSFPLLNTFSQMARSKELVYGVGRLSRSQVFAKRGLHKGIKKSEKPAVAEVSATKEKQEAERREREGDKGDEPRRPIERPKIVWFKPTDKRVPLIAIPTEQAPPDFVQNSEAYANKLFVACIKRHVRPHHLIRPLTY